MCDFAVNIGLHVNCVFYIN